MTAATIRAAIKTRLEAVTDIGVVHDYERWSRDAKAFRALYLSTTHESVRAWTIRLASRSERSPDLGRYAVTRRWAIRGYMSLDDSTASQKTFEDLVEAAVDAFRADDTLGGTVDTCVLADVAGLQVESLGPVMLGDVLCHAAQCTLNTRSFL